MRGDLERVHEVLRPAIDGARIVEQGAHDHLARIDRCGAGVGDGERAHLGHHIGVDLDLGLAARPAPEQASVAWRTNA